MRKRLQIVLMASTIAATSLFFAPQFCVAEDSDGSSQATTTQITATDDNGHKVYVNDFAPPKPVHRAEEATPRRNLMYWSSKENRWKPVPPPNAAAMQAARSAAAEVSRYLGRDSARSANAKIVAANFRGTLAPATPADIDSAIEEAAARHNVDPNLARGGESGVELQS